MSRQTMVHERLRISQRLHFASLRGPPKPRCRPRTRATAAADEKNAMEEALAWHTRSGHCKREACRKAAAVSATPALNKLSRTNSATDRKREAHEALDISASATAASASVVYCVCFYLYDHPSGDKGIGGGICAGTPMGSQPAHRPRHIWQIGRDKTCLLEQQRGNGPDTAVGRACRHVATHVPTPNIPETYPVYSPSILAYLDTFVYPFVHQYSCSIDTFICVFACGRQISLRSKLVALPLVCDSTNDTKPSWLIRLRSAYGVSRNSVMLPPNHSSG